MNTNLSEKATIGIASCILETVLELKQIEEVKGIYLNIVKLNYQYYHPEIVTERFCLNIIVEERDNKKQALYSSIHSNSICFMNVITIKEYMKFLASDKKVVENYLSDIVILYDENDFLKQQQETGIKVKNQNKETGKIPKQLKLAINDMIKTL